MYGEPNSLPSRPSVMSVNWADWKWRKISVTDESKRDTFYNVECHLRKPNLIFHTPQGVEPIATVSHSKIGTQIVSNVNGATLEMKPKNRLTGREWSYHSASHGQGISWKGIYGMECFDESGVPIARFKISNSMGLTSLGKLELLNPNLNPQTLDEVIVTGVGLMYMILTNTVGVLSSSNASASSAAAAAAA